MAEDKSGEGHIRIKMTELLLDIQRSKKNGDPKYLITEKDGGYVAEVCIFIDSFTFIEFTSDVKETIREATDDAAKKAIDSCISTYGIKIIDYSSEALEKLAVKYMLLEVRNTQLDLSNKTLLDTLAKTQRENRKLKELNKKLKVEKSKAVNDTECQKDKVMELLKVKDELHEMLAYDNEYRHVESMESVRQDGGVKRKRNKCSASVSQKIDFKN